MTKRPRTWQCHNKKTSDDLTETFKAKILALSDDDPKVRHLQRSFFDKFVSGDTAPAEVRQARAINKWLAAEAENEATNDRLITTCEEYNILPRVSLIQFLDHCRDLVEEIIGATAPVEALIGSFSGGASTSRNRTESYPAGKYLGRAHVTERCLSIWEEIISPELLGWTSGTPLEFEIVPGNVMFTVPKKTDIDRCACKEPDVNMFVQKGIGNFIRKCLHSTNINLNDQSINRRLAREGSVTGRLATLDLSSASDSVTTELVAMLLPVSWYTLLDSVRSPVTILPNGETHRNEMFSSMGNGYTFELESLIFYVLTRTTCFFTGHRGSISVYGDDIICPSAVVPDLTWVLQFFGFSVNLEKSYSEGPFRESCGGHYWNGIDITPFYVRKPIDTLVDVIHVANSLRKWSQFSDDIIVLDPRVEEIWYWLKSLVPEHLWGGGDTSFKYQLVSADAPSHRLVEETKRHENGTGGYYHWLNATWDRDQLRDGVSTSKRTRNLGVFRTRPVRDRAVPRLSHLFYQEIDVTPSSVHPDG